MGAAVNQKKLSQDDSHSKLSSPLQEERSNASNPSPIATSCFWDGDAMNNCRGQQKLNQPTAAKDLSRSLAYGELIPLGLIPHAKSPAKCICVTAQTTALREFPQLLGIASTENNFVGLQRVAEVSHGVCDVFAPFCAPPLFQAPPPNVVLVGPLPVVKMSKLQRFNSAVDDEARTKACA